MHVTCVPIRSMSCARLCGDIPNTPPCLDHYPRPRLLRASTGAAPTMKPPQCHGPASDAGRQPLLLPASALRPRHPCPTAAAPMPRETQCSKGKGTLSSLLGLPRQGGREGARPKGTPRLQQRPLCSARAQRPLDLETASRHGGKGARSAPSRRVPPPRSREVAVFPHGRRPPRSQAGKGARSISLSPAFRPSAGVGFLVRERHGL